MNEQDVDLEEAVGSYLNCLSQSCAAGSKLYTSVHKIIDNKFNEIFPIKQIEESDGNNIIKTCFQSLQTQNAFEDYQKALLECKDKLLEILIDSHTKKYSGSSKKKSESSEEQQYTEIALRVAKELHCYHQTVADILKPLHFSDFPEDFENATLTNVHGKDEVLSAWTSICEANKPLRQGYGLSSQEISQILSWQHGEDVSETCRKKLNAKINSLIQGLEKGCIGNELVKTLSEEQYVNQLFCYGVCELDIPVAFDIYPEDLQKVLTDCCSRAESFAASSICIPHMKEEIELILHRELPRVCLCLNGRYIEKANPGKAFENTTQKMRAVRDAIKGIVESKQINVSKEQIDIFCLRVLATCSMSISSASSRTAALMAFGKYNLVQVIPYNPDGEKNIYMNVHKEMIEIIIPSKWCIVEDAKLFKSLCRDSAMQPIAVVNVSYHAIVNVEEYLVKKIEPIPVAHITKCVLKRSPTSETKKEQERSKSIKLRLTKATTKFFQKKSIVKDEIEPDVIKNEFAAEELKRAASKESASEEIATLPQPVRPPRPKRNAKKKLEIQKPSDIEIPKENDPEVKPVEGKKEDLGWFSSSPKFGLPPVPTLSGSKNQSPSVASFEELQGVIDFLSGSSSSSLAINEKGEKKKPHVKAHKRNNSTTSLQIDSKTKSKVVPEGKLKLCHKKSASFSGNSAADKKETSESDKDQDIEKLKRMSAELDNGIKTDNIENNTENKDNKETDNQEELKAIEKDDESSSSNEESIPFIERTPGDGMDNKQEKTVSTVNIKKHVIDSKEEESAINNDSKNVVINDEKETKDISKEDLRRNSSPELPEQLKKSDTKINEKSQPKSIQVNSLDSTVKESGILSKDTNTKNAEVINAPSPKPRLSKLDPGKVEGAKMIQQNKVLPVKMESVTTKAELFLSNMMSKVQVLRPFTPSNSQEVTGQPSSENTLYEPFNSRSSWAGIGNSLNNWSDSTLDTEKTPVATSEKITPTKSSSSSSNSSDVVEFTLDKQQDFQKLLEGSRYMSAGCDDKSDNWKDRTILGSQTLLEDSISEMYRGTYEPSNTDPWPLQSNRSNSYSPFQSHTPYNYNRNNINSLQLPPNPSGPYMRQNREQLLAKQQILEQYARQQKQLQLQQQQQQQQQNASLSFQQPQQQNFGRQIFTNNNNKLPTGLLGSNYGNNVGTTSHYNIDRTTSLPPGLSLTDRSYSNHLPQRYDAFSDRGSFYQRSPSRGSNTSSRSSLPFNAGASQTTSGLQSRSVNDLRLDSNPLTRDQTFGQLSEQNLFLDQRFNVQANDSFGHKF